MRRRRLGPGPRRQAERLTPVAHRRPSTRQGADLHPVRRHGALPGGATTRSRRDRAGGRHGRLAGSHRRGLAFQPGEQRETPAGASRRRAAGGGRYGCLERRPESAGRRHRGQLRSAVGDHPTDPARGPRGSYRPAGRGDPLLLVPAGGWRGAHHPAARACAAALDRKCRSRWDG